MWAMLNDFVPAEVDAWAPPSDPGYVGPAGAVLAAQLPSQEMLGGMFMDIMTAVQAGPATGPGTTPNPVRLTGLETPPPPDEMTARGRIGATRFGGGGSFVAYHDAPLEE
jgi:hypothetical protein